MSPQKSTWIRRLKGVRETVTEHSYFPKRHTIAIFEGLFVAFLWSTSYILIKVGLRSMPALSFAGLRYLLAVVVLLPFVIYRYGVKSVVNLSYREASWLILLGVLWYAATPSTHYYGLRFLPAVTVSMLINLEPILIAVVSGVWLSEPLRRTQWWGVVLYTIGVGVYFAPTDIPTTKLIGLGIMLVHVVVAASSTIIGRVVNRKKEIPSPVVTLLSMSVGAVVLMSGGLTVQQFPQLTFSNWSIIVVLALFNTAIAYALWDHALRELSAAEASIILSTILVQVAILGAVFLGETITLRETIGLVVVGSGTLVVQYYSEQH